MVFYGIFCTRLYYEDCKILVLTPLVYAGTAQLGFKMSSIWFNFHIFTLLRGQDSSLLMNSSTPICIRSVVTLTTRLTIIVGAHERAKNSNMAGVVWISHYSHSQFATRCKLSLVLMLSLYQQAFRLLFNGKCTWINLTTNFSGSHPQPTTIRNLTNMPYRSPHILTAQTYSG